MIKFSERVKSPDEEAADSTTLEDWPDQKLIDSYYRYSELLKHYGFDQELADRMGRVEEELRKRDNAPEEIIRDLWDD